MGGGTVTAIIAVLAELLDLQNYVQWSPSNSNFSDSKTHQVEENGWSLEEHPLARRKDL